MVLLLLSGMPLAGCRHTPTALLLLLLLLLLSKAPQGVCCSPLSPHAAGPVAQQAAAASPAQPPPSCIRGPASGFRLLQGMTADRWCSCCNRLLLLLQGATAGQ
jgi:hypothetical protein